jgi:hypothetical protein
VDRRQFIVLPNLVRNTPGAVYDTWAVRGSQVRVLERHMRILHNLAPVT